MYKIEIATKNKMQQKYEDAILEAVKEADAQADCQFEDQAVEILSHCPDTEMAAYILGVSKAGCTHGGIVKLSFNYEKQQ